MFAKFKSLLFLLVLTLTAGCIDTSPPAAPTQSTIITMPAPTSLPSATYEPTTTPTQTPTSVPPTSTPEPVNLQPPISEVVASLDGLPVEDFFEESYRYLRLRNPDILFMNEFSGVYGVIPEDHFTELSEAYIQDTQQLENELLEMLRAYDREALTEDQKISYDALEWILGIHIQGHAFADYKFLVNPVWGLQDWPIEFLLEYPLDNTQDVENYIARISSLRAWGDQVIDGLERNEQAGAIPPRYVLEETINQLDNILKSQGTNEIKPEILEIYTNLRSKIHHIDGLEEQDKETYLASALTAIEGSFIPAYMDLRDHLVYLTTIAVEDPNEWELPGGEDYYSYLLAYYTGTDLSADEVHSWAVSEVDKIRKEIDDAAVAAGYPGGLSMVEINQKLSEDSPVITGNDLRELYEEILADADQASEDYFDLRTSAEVVIKSEKINLPGFYDSPEPGSDEPGIMPVNLGLSPLLINYNEHVFVHHETIPGHHTQLALAQELDLPNYQRFYCVHPAMQQYDLLMYAEGWALYSETLGWEMGLYEGDPLANLGRLRLLLLRIVRAVVDTGIHAKGWTLDEAAAYLEEVTGMPQNRLSMMRYLVNPGYPTSYNIARLKLFEMRKHAQEELGTAFDIKQFHNVILGNGLLPISVLEGVVNDWIASELDQ